MARTAIKVQKHRLRGCKPADLDGVKRHADARQLNADVVSPAVLHQGDSSAAGGRQLSEGCVLQNLQATEQLAPLLCLARWFTCSVPGLDPNPGPF